MKAEQGITQIVRTILSNKQGPKTSTLVTLTEFVKLKIMENKSVAKGCLGLITFSSAGFFLATTFAAFGNIMEGGPKLGVSIGVFIFLVGLVGFFSFATYKIFSKKKVIADPQLLERKALAFAHSKNGYVAVADLALREKLSIDDAGKILDELAVKNVARVEISGSGKLFYVFDAFVDADNSRKDTLEIAIENARTATVVDREGVTLDLEAKKKAAEEAVVLHAEVDTNANY